MAYLFGAATTHKIDVSGIANGGTSWSLAIRAALTGNSTSARRTLFFNRRASDGAANAALSFVAGTNNNPLQAGFTYSNTGGSHFPTWDPSGITAAQGIHTYVVTYNGTTLATYLDTDATAKFTEAASQTPDPGGVALIGNTDTVSWSFDGTIYELAWWPTTTLTGAQAATIGAGGPITGITLPTNYWPLISDALALYGGVNGTVTGASVVAHSGTNWWNTNVVGAVTLAALTSAGAGTVAVVGVAAPTLAAVTAAGVGTVALVGAVAVTLGALTASGAGTTATQGVAALLLEDLRVATGTQGTGTVAIAGAAAVTLGAVTSSSAGTVATQGAGAATLDALTAVAAGVVGSTPILGAAAMTLAPLTSQALGTLALAGLAAVTLNPVTASGAGTVTPGGVLGVAALGLGPVLGAGVGLVAPLAAPPTPPTSAEVDALLATAVGHTDRDPGWTVRPWPVPLEDHQPKLTVIPGPWPYDPADETNVWYAMSEGT